MGAEPDDAPASQRYRTSLVVAGCPYVQTMQDFGDVLPSMMRHILQQRYRSSPVIAGCPYVQTMQDFGDVLADPMMRYILQPDILRGVRRAFDKHRPMLDVLDASKFRGRNSRTMIKERVHVEHAADVVYDWVSREGGGYEVAIMLQGFLQALRFGGISPSVRFLEKVRRCNIYDVSITKSQYRSIMVARLCLADSFSCMFEFGEADSSDDGGCSSILGRLNDTFAVYRQLNAAELWPTETFAVYGQLNAADLSPAEV